MTKAAREPASARPPALSGKDRYQRFLQADLERSQAMAPEQAVDADHVSGVILKDLDRLRGNVGDWRVEPQPLRGRDSWVFKAHTPAAPWPLAVKVYCAAVTGEDIAAEGEHLRRCHEQMAARPDLTVPAFWASLPRHRTLIMQWIEAPRMDELLGRAGGRREERSRLFAAAGAWLRHYHAQSATSMRPLKVASFPRHIDMLLGGEDGAGRHVRDGIFRASYEALIEQAGAFAERRVAHVMAHGDFVPHNVFHGGGRTIGFDMVPRTRPALSDICHFLVHAEVRKPLLFRRGTRGPTGIEQRDVDAFFDAYGGLEPLGGGAVAVYMQLNETLLRWAVVISHRRRGGRPRREQLTDWMRYRGLARAAAFALQQGRGLDL